MSAMTASSRRSEESPWKGLGEKFNRALAAPQMNYKVIMTVTVILVFIGLTMVLSSSMVSITNDGAGLMGSPMPTRLPVPVMLPL